eukprot:Em0012g109a
MGGLLELSFLSSTCSITTTVSEYRYGWPPERYLPSFCSSNLEKAEDTMKVHSKWRPTAIIYLTTRAVIAEQRARKTCFHLYLYSYTEWINPVGWPTFNIHHCSKNGGGHQDTQDYTMTMWSASSSGSRLSGDRLVCITTTNKFPYIIRVCGQRITKYRAKKRECKAFSAELKIAFDIDTSGDGVNIHPEMFCMHFPVDAKGAEVCSVLQHPLTDTGTAISTNVILLLLLDVLVHCTDCSRDVKAGDYHHLQEASNRIAEKIRGIVNGEASALIEKEVLILSDEERRSLLDKAGFSSSIELGQLRWLKLPGICLAAFAAGDSVTNLHVALDLFKDQLEHLHGMKWR